MLRYGSQTDYWLDAEMGDQHRFEGNNSAFTAPVVVDIVERSPRTIAIPDRDVVPVSQIRELYETATP